MAEEAGGSGAPGDGLILKSPFQRKKDVFDAEDFQAVRFINQIYPDGGRRHRPRGAGGWHARCALAPRPCAAPHPTRRRAAAPARARARAVPPPRPAARRRRPCSAARRSPPRRTPCFVPPAEASLGDLDKFMDVLRKQVRSGGRGAARDRMRAACTLHARRMRAHAAAGRGAGSGSRPRPGLAPLAAPAAPQQRRLIKVAPPQPALAHLT
jgi:hypothetical protein